MCVDSTERMLSAGNHSHGRAEFSHVKVRHCYWGETLQKTRTSSLAQCTTESTENSVFFPQTDDSESIIRHKTFCSFIQKENSSVRVTSSQSPLKKCVLQCHIVSIILVLSHFCMVFMDFGINEWTTGIPPQSTLSLKTLIVSQSAG